VDLLKSRIWTAGLVVSGLLLAAGCETTTEDNQGTITLAQLQGIEVLEPIQTGNGTGNGGTTGGGTNGVISSDDAVPYGNLRWNRGGVNFAGAERDPRVTIRNVVVSRGGRPTLTYSGTGLNVWPTSMANITHIWAIFFDDNRDGVYERGGKFDWGRANAAARPLHHIADGYGGWNGYPRPGTPWAAVITDKFGRKRSNVAAGVWP
jgi:hypothetical protein